MLAVSVVRYEHKRIKSKARIWVLRFLFVSLSSKQELQLMGRRSEPESMVAASWSLESWETEAEGLMQHAAASSQQITVVVWRLSIFKSYSSTIYVVRLRACWCAWRNVWRSCLSRFGSRGISGHFKHGFSSSLHISACMTHCMTHWLTALFLNLASRRLFAVASFFPRYTWMRTHGKQEWLHNFTLRSSQPANALENGISCKHWKI